MKRIVCSCGVTTETLRKQSGLYPKEWFELVSPMDTKNYYIHRMQESPTHYAKECPGTCRVEEVESEN